MSQIHALLVKKAINAWRSIIWTIFCVVLPVAGMASCALAYDDPTISEDGPLEQKPIQFDLNLFPPSIVTYKLLR